MAASRKWLRWVIVAVVAVVGLAIAAPFIYIHFIEDDPAPRLELTSPTPTSVGASNDAATESTDGSVAALTGTWTVGDGSKAQYRVDEVLFGQDNTATGSTNDVTGKVVIAGRSVRSADISVDLTTVKSDESRRDNQFQGRIMDTAQFPTATFKLTSPIDLGTLPPEGTAVTVPATGDLTLHGVTKSITTNLKAQRLGAKIEVNGTVPVVFADYQIPNPSFAGITTKDHGEFEFLLELTKS